MLQEFEYEASPTQSVLVETILLTWREFASVTSIHGFKFLIDPQGNYCTKAMWVIMIIGGFVASNLLVETFWLRYKSNPTRLSVLTKHQPSTSLKLPGVTICPLDRINMNRAHVFINSLKIPNNVTKDMVLEYLSFSTGFLENTSYNREDLQAIQDILNVNRIGTEQVMSYLSHSCEDMLIKCRWKFEPMQCSRLFTTSFTYRGSCCTFNLKSNLESTPYFTAEGGLTVAIFPQITNSSFSSTYSEGVKLLVHERNIFPSDQSVEKMIPHHYETLVQIDAVETVCSSEVRSLSMADRECLFHNERSLRFFSSYKENNCEVECRMLKIVNFCNCLPYYFKNEEGIPVCNFTKIECLVDNYFPIHETRDNQPTACNCPSNCNKFSFEAKIYRAWFTPSNFSVDPFYEGLNTSHLILNVQFGTQVYTIMRRDLLTSVISLAASLGGVYSLFIGMSVLSFFEIIYFCTIRFHANLKRLKQKRFIASQIEKPQLRRTRATVQSDRKI